MPYDYVNERLQRIKPQLETLYREIAINGDSYLPKDADDRLLAREMHSIGESLYDIVRRLDVIAAPVIVEGGLSLNSAGRWAVHDQMGNETDYYYTSGSGIEFLHIRDDDEPVWIRSRVEATDGRYYIVGFSKVKLQGLRVRVREMPRGIL